MDGVKKLKNLNLGATQFKQVFSENTLSQLDSQMSTEKFVNIKVV